MTPGFKGAMFLPRSALKSTIATHGGASWELIRNPDLRIGITHEIAERTQEFVSTVIYTFSANELHQWLYPEYRKSNRNNVTLELANRRRKYVDPNLRALTAGGSAGSFIRGGFESGLSARARDFARAFGSGRALS